MHRAELMVVLVAQAVEMVVGAMAAEAMAAVATEAVAT